jgi:hypothetical protein
MLHVHAKSISTVAAASLVALLHGCVAEGADPVASDLAGLEQALTAPLPHLAPGVAAALEESEMSGRIEALGAGRHDQDEGDLFALAEGRWVGECEILVPGQAEPTLTVEMERITEPTENPDEYTWTIIYRGPGFEQVRPYTILADRTTPGRYVVDEHNGILLPSYLVDGNILVSEFEVQGIRLLTREVFRGKKYDFEISIMSATPELSSDLGDGFVVDSYRVSSMQKCELRRRGPRH